PISDRIDLHVEVPVVDIKKLSEDKQLKNSLESSAEMRKRVVSAREIQSERFETEKIHTNSEMKNRHIRKYCHVSKEVKQLLTQAGAKFQISARSYYKMIKVARTIADLGGLKDIAVSHMAEALQYRPRIQEGDI
ncbi:MAG: magnesium chelatase, partial [Candidatus Aureabacteria bacterium]|nr:magnesium chelatase [Candidatus Auribacterota bacterium]